jgi:hypothetical protein
MTDFYSGWSFPRHLYSSDVYRSWGNLPYEQGDYLTDLVLEMLYPGYQDSSYFHDETGFLTPTPYGDAADCLLSDAPGWVLARYPVLVVTGDLTPGAEIREKLRAYAAGGGRLLVSARNVERLGGLDGVALTVIPDPEPAPVGPIASEVDKPLARPYRLTPQARQALDKAFRAQMLFEAGDGLSLITARRGPGEYTLGITNNAWQQRPFRIVSHCGPIESVQELTLDEAERSAPGLVPEGLEARPLGSNGEHTIAGGDLRIFRVRVREQGVEEIAHVAPPARPQGRILALRGIRSIEEAVVARPTFFQHFDGVLVDWRAVHERESAALEREGRWIRQQRLRVVVDLSSGLNLYPDLRLVDNSGRDYAASREAIAGVIAKMPLLGATDLMLSLHRVPENNITEQETWAGFEKTLREICKSAAERGVTVHLRQSLGKPPETLTAAAAFVRKVGAPNLRIAPSTALLIAKHATPEAATRELDGLLGLWLAAAPRLDVAGKLWDTHATLAGRAEVPEFLKSSPAPVVFDAVYASQDEEYLDAQALERR